MSWLFRRRGWDWKYPKSKYYMNRAYTKPQANTGYSKTQRRLARRVSRLEKKARAVELKTHDVAINHQTTSTGVVTYLSGIQQGDQSVEREGLKIVPKKLYGKFRLTGDGNAANVEGIRIIIFRDKDCDGAAPAATDVLEAVGCTQLFKHENRNRFHIMYDKTYDCQPAAGSEDSRFYIKITAKVGPTIYYGGTTAAIASADSNALFMLTVGDTASDSPSILGNMRLRYYG